MNIMKNLIFLALCILLSTSSYSQADARYSKTLKTMFEVSGAEETFKVSITQMIELYKQQYTGVSVKVWNELEKEFLKTSIDDLVDMLAPVYSKHMTESDLEVIIRFYRSPVGAKFSQKTPLITRESMLVGQKWGEKVGEDLTKILSKKGY